MIRLEKMSKYYYSKRHIVLGLRNIDLEFKSGEFVAITGESGSGKSTLLNVISGLDTFEQGKMYVNEQDISTFSDQELEEYRKENIAFVFQNYNIIDSYTVEENIELPLIFQGVEKEERKEIVSDLIQKVDLIDKRNQKASSLSGGEKQRTVIARALAKNAPIIIADEPTGNLDVASSKRVIELLAEISKERLVIIVTHDYESIHEYVTRKIRLYDGEIVEDSVLKPFTQAETSKPVFTSKLVDLVSLSIRNLVSVPKKTIFMLMFLTFIVSSIFLMYGNNLRTINSANSATTHYFPNSRVERLIVTKYGESFTETELEDISKLEYVNSLIHNDSILDTTLVTGKYNDEYQIDQFYEFEVNSIDMLNEQLIEGRLPEKPGEVVIREHDQFRLEERIYFSNAFTVVPKEGTKTNDYSYRIVGFISAENTESSYNKVFMVNEDLMELNETVVYENSMVELQVNEFKYNLTADVRIDNSLEDDVVLAYDLMFYDIMIDMKYIVYGPGDMPVLLVDAEDLARFLAENSFYINAYSTFEDYIEPNEVIMTSEIYEPHPFGTGIYMNSYTYNKLFDEEVYQITVAVDGKFEANKVREELDGYNTFYPSEIITADVGYLILIRNIQMSLMFGFTVIVIYFIGYFVLKNILNSKQKDYTINRSVGATIKNLRTIIGYELAIASSIAYLSSIGLIYYIEKYIDFTVLRYFRWNDYLTIYLITLVIVYMISRRFNKSMFKNSVITSLKSEVGQ